MSLWNTSGLAPYVTVTRLHVVFATLIVWIYWSYRSELWRYVYFPYMTNIGIFANKNFQVANRCNRGRVKIIKFQNVATFRILSPGIRTLTPKVSNDRTGKKGFTARFFPCTCPESRQATLFPRISFSISGQDLTKILVLVRLSSITWLRTVHETATKAAQVTYGYELCKRTSCMTSDRETRPWPRADSFHQLDAASAEYSHRVAPSFVLLGHDAKTLWKIPIADKRIYLTGSIIVFSANLE